MVWELAISPELHSDLVSYVSTFWSLLSGISISDLVHFNRIRHRAIEMQQNVLCKHHSGGLGKLGGELNVFN